MTRGTGMLSTGLQGTRTVKTQQQQLFTCLVALLPVANRGNIINHLMVTTWLTPSQDIMVNCIVWPFTKNQVLADCLCLKLICRLFSFIGFARQQVHVCTGVAQHFSAFQVLLIDCHWDERQEKLGEGNLLSNYLLKVFVWSIFVWLVVWFGWIRFDLVINDNLFLFYLICEFVLGMDIQTKYKYTNISVYRVAALLSKLIH